MALWGKSLGHAVALAAVAVICLTSAVGEHGNLVSNLGQMCFPAGGASSALLCAGQPTFDAGSQLPDATNSKTMAEGRAMILADPVDVQVCCNTTGYLSALLVVLKV